jgi:hypothetical protein
LLFLVQASLKPMRPQLRVVVRGQWIQIVEVKLALEAELKERVQPAKRQH